MSPSNRVDEMSEHLQWLGLLMIDALPETLKRLKVRAVNAIRDGGIRLNMYRQSHHKQDLSDEMMQSQYSNITSAKILPQHAWEIEYMRYIIELNFCTQHLLKGDVPVADVEGYTKRRQKLLKLLVQMEKDHGIQIRWNVEAPERIQEKCEAVKVWIDAIVEELRSATAKQLNANDMIYDHGHSKSFPIPIIFTNHHLC
jgi:hypothetical protein